MKIELRSKIKKDKYTQYVYDTLDVQESEESIVEVEFSLGEAKNFDWNIGVIYGGSGSGKSTILKKMGDIKEPIFDNDKPLISNFDWLEPKDASFLLTSIGLSSIPTWLRPFRTLSNGEQYRAKVAYLIGKANENEVVLIDEFTSVVDRDVAKAMSFSMQKYLRRNNKRVVVASCHYDIMEWLTPDWTCSPQKGGALERGQWLRQSRPKIELQVSRVESDTWDLFKKHHYLTESVNKSCKFFLFTWNDKPVGIVAIINQPRKGCANGYALSRTVVLPDFQGMGLGTKISEFCASMFVGIGGKVYTKTVNPALGEYRNKSDKFRPTGRHMKVMSSSQKKTDKTAKNRLQRPSYCHEYIGEGISGYEELLKPIKEMRENKNKQTKLF
jgi:energy-coupling factor transporter ATP-binding protein EcfA2